MFIKKDTHTHTRTHTARERGVTTIGKICNGDLPYKYGASGRFFQVSFHDRHTYDIQTIVYTALED